MGWFDGNPTSLSPLSPKDEAEKFITLYWADTVSDWLSTGVRGGGQTRTYKENYLRRGGSYSFHELLYAYGWHTGTGSFHPVILHPATSTYRVPEMITAIATDAARPGFFSAASNFFILHVLVKKHPEASMTAGCVLGSV